MLGETATLNMLMNGYRVGKGLDKPTIFYANQS
jgi:hypothetical protein